MHTGSLENRSDILLIPIANPGLLAWDHIITLRAEVTKMWPKKLSAPTVLYFLLRYGTLLEKVAVMLLASWYMTPHVRLNSIHCGMWV